MYILFSLIWLLFLAVDVVFYTISDPNIRRSHWAYRIIPGGGFVALYKSNLW